MKIQDVSGSNHPGRNFNERKSAQGPCLKDLKSEEQDWAHSGWQARRKEGETNGDSTMETYAPVWNADSHWGFAVWLRNSHWGSVTTYRGGLGWQVEGSSKSEGTYECLWLIHVGVWQKPTYYCKAIIFQLKINNFKKKKSKRRKKRKSQRERRHIEKCPLRWNRLRCTWLLPSVVLTEVFEALRVIWT